MAARSMPAPARRAGGVSDPHEWITVAEAAQRCGVNPVTLRRAARVGNLESRASSKVWLTTVAAVRVWLKEAGHRTGPKPGQGLGRPRGTPTTSSPAPARD